MVARSRTTERVTSTTNVVIKKVEKRFLLLNFNAFSQKFFKKIPGCPNPYGNPAVRMSLSFDADP
jgi:hypothetical protein